MPVEGAEPVAGEVTVWSPGGGIVVTIRVRINLGSVTELLGTQVWVRVRAPEALIVVRGLAQPVGMFARFASGAWLSSTVGK